MIYLSILTVASIALVVHSFYTDNEAWQIISIILLIIVGAGGWGGWNCCSTKNEIKTQAKVVELLKGKHIVVVVTDDTSNNTHVFKEYEADKITDSTKFYWVHYYNQYNVDKTSETIFIHE
jgi:thioredoxin-related protein